MVLKHFVDAPDLDVHELGSCGVVLRLLAGQNSRGSCPVPVQQIASTAWYLPSYHQRLIEAQHATEPLLMQKHVRVRVA